MHRKPHTHQQKSQQIQPIQQQIHKNQAQIMAETERRTAIQREKLPLKRERERERLCRNERKKK